jgi:hypothetical protein
MSKELETLSVSAVMAAMANFADASHEEETAREAYDGYSWGYHGSHYIDAVVKSREAAEKCLQDYIAAEVARQIAMLNEKDQ